MGKNILTRELLLKSVEEWNTARAANPKYKPDLNGADLNGANLHGALLIDASLRSANLHNSNLRQAHLGWAKLNDANLSGADLSESNLVDANLTVANLSGVNFSGANLSGVNFAAADITKANFHGAIVGDSTFGDVDLSGVFGLDTIKHKSPSTIGIDTIYKSHGKIPEVFLRGCGVPDSFIEYARSLTASAIDYYSCFISYCTKDDDFASRIHNDLQASGVRCWFAPHNIQGGKKVLDQVEEAICHYDKLLLILSPDSMKSNWVETEIINAIQKEKKLQKQVLFPIGIVPFEKIKQWKRFDPDCGRDLAREIREYHIPDFSRWGSDQTAYKKAFDRLLKDLKQ